MIIGRKLVKAIDSIEKGGERDADAAFQRLLAERQALSLQAWNDLAGGVCRDDADVSKTGVVSQSLPLPIAQKFLDGLARTPRSMLRRDDFAPGYMATLSPVALESLNEVNEYRTPTREVLSLTATFLADRATEIEALCGHPWRAASVRMFYLKPGGPGGVHTDGWPLAIKKLFILPNGATPETGSTYFRLRSGADYTVDHPAPLWMIFENSVLPHALVPPRIGKRPTIEVDLVPALRTSPALMDAGINGWYPWFPSGGQLRHATLNAFEKVYGRPRFGARLFAPIS